MSSARKIVLISKRGYDSSHDDLLRSLIERKIRLFCVVGPQCALWEEVMDELSVGPDGASSWHITTTSHPNESVADVLQFARDYPLDEATEVEVIEA